LEIQFWESIETFVIDRSAVRDHALRGVLQGKRAFSVTDEYRIVYLERTDYYLFIDVGTHEQVYRR
jgi:mRNA-degrading endonuclease YafQ of YafQ-DinJ toxin-antitoxin module